MDEGSVHDDADTNVDEDIEAEEMKFGHSAPGRSDGRLDAYNPKRKGNKMYDTPAHHGRVSKGRIPEYDNRSMS